MATCSIETQHADVIHDTQFDYYGRFMATASSDKTVRIFATGEEGQGAHIATLTGHDGPVWMIQWAHPSFGTALASCSYDNKAIVWKAPAQEGGAWAPSTIITAHSASVNGISFAPPGTAPSLGLALATAGSDGHVYVHTCPDGKWREPVNVAAGEPSKLAHAMGAMSVSFAPALKNDTSAPLLASGGADSTVKVWAFSQDGWTLVATHRDHADWVRDVAFSPDASSAYLTLASCSQDKTVIIRRAAKKEDGSLSWETSSPVEFSDTVWRLSWSPCGTMLLVTTADSQAFVLKPGAQFGDEWIRTPTNFN